MKNYSVFDKIKRIKPISSILSLISPGFSNCEKCGLTWNFCESKTVYYNIHSGTFATCDYCWDHSTLEQLKIYYTRVYRKQERSSLLCGFKMDHSLKELLDSVEEEYYKNFSYADKMKDIRKTKINNILRNEK